MPRAVTGHVEIRDGVEESARIGHDEKIYAILYPLVGRNFWILHGDMPKLCCCRSEYSKCRWNRLNPILRELVK